MPLASVRTLPGTSQHVVMVIHHHGKLRVRDSHQSGNTVPRIPPPMPRNETQHRELSIPEPQSIVHFAEPLLVI